MSIQHLPCAVWQYLGLQLGLYHSTLVEIEMNNRGNSVMCFRECISAWLRGKDKVLKDTDGPSWFSLVSALETIGEYRIAANIKKKYCIF